jgi:hypothetical protein
MDRAQQQFVEEWQGHIREATGQVARLLQEAEAGCKQMLAPRPNDIYPIMNALRAVGLQINEIRVRTGNVWSGQIMSKLLASLDNRAVISSGQAWWDESETWIEESWERFRTFWSQEAARCLWSHASQAIGRPVPCSRCGAPVTASVAHSSETVSCRSCGAVNQLTPDPVVSTYFAMAPDICAERATIEQKLAIARLRRDVEAFMRSRQMSALGRVEEPIESLKHWESLERKYWVDYAAAHAAIKPATPEQQEAFVTSRMKSFSDRLGQNDGWRKAQGLEGKIAPIHVPAHLAASDEWGPLQPSQYEEYEFQHFMLEESREEPARFRELLKKFGYHDQMQYERTRLTFGRHYGMRATDPNVQGAQLRARQRASQEQMAHKTSQAGDLMAPIEGVSLEQYAQLTAQQASGMSIQDFQGVLARHGLDQARFDRVGAAWQERMRTDTTFVVTNAFSKAFSQPAAPPPGQPGQAGGQGGGGGQQPQRPPPELTFEQYCEVMGAQTAWSKTGKDVNAMLKQVFNMTAIDWSNASSVWMAKIMTDPNLSMRMMTLMQQGEAKHMR